MRKPRPGLVLLAALLAGHASAAEKPVKSTGVYTLFKDGKAHEIPTVSEGGEDFLGLTELARAFGAEVRPVRGQASVRIGGSEVRIRAGRDAASVNGESLSLSRAPILLRDRLWVPTDFATKVLAAALARAVKWKDELRLGAAATPPPPEFGVIRSELEIRSQRDYTRVILRVPGLSLLPYAISASSRKLTLRVQADNVEPESPERVVGDGALERIRFEVAAGRGLYTFELGPEYRDYQHSVLRDPFRVVIDLYRKTPYSGPADLAAAPASRPVVPAEPGLPPPPRPAEPDVFQVPAEPIPAAGAGQPGKPGSRGEVRVVVIDPGHGGSEPGARGPRGLLEKDLTLELSRRLAKALEAALGLRVVLTRSSDMDLSLDDRTGIANHEKADLFVSIHANASLRANAHGAETYFLARSATDDESRKLAALENQTLGEARGLEGTDLELILWSLAQNQYLKESQELAETIQKEFNSALAIADRGVKQAPFKVLVGATMPAVLVEVGFLTNPEEEKRLRDEEYRKRLVSALVASVRSFKLARSGGAETGARTAATATPSRSTIR